jgi:phage tail sheath protein FI
MPAYLTPGVYAEEVPQRTLAPVEGAPTSVAAFIGVAPGGPIDTPIRITNWARFQMTFGDPNWPDAGAFADGMHLAHAVFGFFANGGQVCWVVRVQSLRELGVERRRGIDALTSVDEVTMVAAPDLVALADDPLAFVERQVQLIAHCEAAGDRMAILDPPPDLWPEDVRDWRMSVAGHDSRHATLYWPWIEVMDPITQRPVLVPPSGHIAGTWARSDLRRGIHKAPANEPILGAHAPAFTVTVAEQGSLNSVGINCLRVFPGRGIRAWGARTLSSDPEWRYINHRRFVAYVSEALAETIRWATFEPNDPSLWVQLRIAAGSFLTRLWRDGALVGATPEEAFTVRCDEVLNPPETVEAGQVVVEVGLALVRPAEFLVFRLSQSGASPTDVPA